MRVALHQQVIDRRRSPKQRLERLIEFVFDKKGLGVEYQPNATRTVGEVYRDRKANCLSSTIFIIALAREAGLDAYGQQIQRILSWGAADEIVMQSMHANAIVEVERRRYVVDVDASDAVSATDALRPVSDERVLALFFGNRAMELMVAGRQSESGPWLKAALSHAPDDPALLNNMGVLRLRTGDLLAAENYFVQAIAKDPALTSALSNLVSYYRARGDLERTKFWEARANKILQKDPYYQFEQGRRFEQAGDFENAARQYRRAIKLNRLQHQFHFAMARVHSHLGDSTGVKRELKNAYELSLGGARAKYSAKLTALQKRH